MIKNCFIDDQPDFYKVVELDGEKIATIHALTKNDLSAIEKAAYRKRLVNGDMELDINSHALLVTRIYRSLTGEKDAGWELGKPITDETIGKLQDKYFYAINNAILELMNQNIVTKDVSKN